MLFILIHHMFIPYFPYTYAPMTVVSMVHIKQAWLNWFNYPSRAEEKTSGPGGCCSITILAQLKSEVRVWHGKYFSIDYWWLDSAGPSSLSSLSPQNKLLPHSANCHTALFTRSQTSVVLYLPSSSSFPSPSSSCSSSLQPIFIS